MVRYGAVEPGTVDGLLETLQELKAHGLPGNALVTAWDPDSEEWETVTGLTFEADEGGTVRIYTDEP